jgi:hypothetical protein
MEVVDTIVASPRDANDVPLQKIEMFITYTGVNDSIPASPALNNPADGSTGILNTQQFTWTSVPGAVLYTLQLSTDPNFTTIDHAVNSGLTSTSVTAMAGSTNYYWRVLANNGGHESVPTTSRSFTSATAAASLIYPADTSIGLPVNPVFQWSSVPNATSYTLQVSTSSTFTTQSMVYNTAGITGTSQQVNGLNPNTLYYWRVRSANGTEQGFYSVKFTFTTGTSTGIAEANNDFLLMQCQPNPVSDLLQVSIHNKNNEVLLLEICDIKGQKVYSAYPETKAGKIEHSVNLNTLESGIYFLYVRSATGSVMRKLVKL